MSRLGASGAIGRIEAFALLGRHRRDHLHDLPFAGRSRRHRRPRLAAETKLATITRCRFQD